MWQTISYVSSVVTCTFCVLYFIGHIWKIYIEKENRYEKFEILHDSNIENNDNVIIIDEVGSEFSISSTHGIRNIAICKIEYEYNTDGELSLVHKEPKAIYKKLNINEPLYIKCDLGSIISHTTQITVERMDYTKVTFDVYKSIKNGNIIAKNYSFKITLRAFLYYLCK